MKRFLLAAALSVSAMAMSAGAALADYELSIIHINDWHSRIESINAFDSTCSEKDETDGKCFGGAARLVTAARERKARTPGENILFLNAGDNFQGSLFYTTYKGEVEAEFLNLMGTDVMVVGNHEFDDGEEGLAPFLDKVTFPVVGSNVKASAASALGDKVKPYVILEVGGEKVAIVGAVTNDTPDIASPGPNVTIADDVASITEQVREVARQGVSKIIALTHVGYPRDLEAIARIPGVDVVVGGHTNTLLSNTVENPAGPYPTWVDNPLGYKVPVVQAYAYSKYLGDLKVTFSDLGIVRTATGDITPLDATVTPDPAVLARVKELGGPIEELKNQVVSETTTPIDGSRDNCRARECEMGNLIADAIIDRTKDQGVTIAVQNGGGIRASIDAGEITMGEVLTVLPFQNTLATFQITGADLVASLEHGVNGIEEGQGRFPQVGGMKYTIDLGVAPNEGRVKDVLVAEGGSYVPIDPAKVYTVGTNNFVRAGGDGYRLFANNAQNAYDFGPSLELVVADYLRARKPFTPSVEGRITVVQAAPAEPEAPAEAEAPAEPAPAEPAPAPEEVPPPPPGAGDIANTPPEVDVAEPAEPAPAEPAPAPAPEQPRTYTVVAGDNLWEIAAKELGDPTRWPEIAELNGLRRPYRLQIGQVLNLPAA